MTLSEYVIKKNGVPMGNNKALSLMLKRAFGAGSFGMFWSYWNPIWGYYLGRFIFKPLKHLFNPAIATLLTFGISGLIHDLAVILIKWKINFFFAPWFFLMGLMVIFNKVLKINYHKTTFRNRVLINASLIVGSFLITRYIKTF